MTFIETVAPERAEGTLAELYEADVQSFGHIANFTRAFSLRPEVYAAWKQLIRAIQADADPRRYELATVAAARRLRSSYCMLAHGSIIAARYPDAVPAALGDTSALDPAEAAVMELAEKIADDATAVAQADVDGLRALGLSDAEILDVVLAAAVRCFFSKVLDGLGAQADRKYADMEPELRDALTVGRPIAD